ncbi:phosphotransferase family protein [Saccharopolyspora sp. NPDC002376]
MTTWAELPSVVRDAVESHVGPVSGATEITVGCNSDLATVLGTSAGRVFVKGVEGVSRRMRFLRNEITAGQLAAGLAPEVVFSEDVGDWLVVGFEHLPGRPADLSPSSPDLPRIADVVRRIGGLPAPGLRPIRARWGGVDWWVKLAADAPELASNWDVDAMSALALRAPELADGDRLVHSDLHGEQFLLGLDSEVHVIDWGFPGAGAAWVDPAYLVLRLVEAGHEPSDAETWARRELPAFAEADDQTVTTFAAYLAGMWTHWAVTDDEPGKQHRARLARNYATWRLRR